MASLQLHGFVQQNVVSFLNWTERYLFLCCTKALSARLEEFLVKKVDSLECISTRCERILVRKVGFLDWVPEWNNFTYLRCFSLQASLRSSVALVLPHLESLAVSVDHVFDYLSVNACPKLKSLCVSVGWLNTTGYTDVRIGQCAQLEHLALHYAAKVTLLPPQLVSLTIQNTAEDPAWHETCVLPASLRVLHISRLPIGKNLHVTCPNLQRLVVWHGRITDCILPSALQELSCCGIEPRTLPFGLRSLYVFLLDDDLCSRLYSCCPKLERLCIADCGLIGVALPKTLLFLKVRAKYLSAFPLKLLTQLYLSPETSWHWRDVFTVFKRLVANGVREIKLTFLGRMEKRTWNTLQDSKLSEITQQRPFQDVSLTVTFGVQNFSYQASNMSFVCNSCGERVVNTTS